METVPTTSEPETLHTLSFSEGGGVRLCLTDLFELKPKMKRGENSQSEERKNDGGFEAILLEENSNLFRTAFENYFFSSESYERKYKKLKRIQKDFQKGQNVVSIIIEIIKCFLHADLKPESLKGWDELREKIKEFVDQRKPIEFAIIGFLCKSTNHQLKTFTFVPDMGEFLALMHLCEFVEWIEKVYQPSACVSIACDTYAWKELFGFDDEIINLYRERLGKMIDFLNQGKFFSRKSKIIELCDHQERIDEILKEEASKAMKGVANAKRRNQELKAKEKSHGPWILKELGEQYVSDFRGFEKYTRNEGKDSEEGQEDMSVPQDSDEIKNTAKSEEEKSQTVNDLKDTRTFEKNLSRMEVVFSKASDFNSQEITKLLPKKIRLSVKERTKVNERISFQLLPCTQNRLSKITKKIHKSLVPWLRGCIVQQTEKGEWTVAVADLEDIKKSISPHLTKDSTREEINNDQESLRMIKVLKDPCLGTPFLVTFTADSKENNMRQNMYESLGSYMQSVTFKSRDSREFNPSASRREEERFANFMP